jgi:hypothetical protein
MYNTVGILYVDQEGKKYLYKSYTNEDELIRQIEKDEEFKKLNPKEVYIVKLENNKIETK